MVESDTTVVETYDQHDRIKGTTQYMVYSKLYTANCTYLYSAGYKSHVLLILYTFNIIYFSILEYAFLCCFSPRKGGMYSIVRFRIHNKQYVYI